MHENLSQGLKPIGFEGFTQGLKPLPPKENDFFRNLRRHARPSSIY